MVKERQDIDSGGSGFPKTVTRCSPSWSMVWALRVCCQPARLSESLERRSPRAVIVTNQQILAAVRVNAEVNDFSLVDIHH